MWEYNKDTRKFVFKGTKDDRLYVISLLADNQTKAMRSFAVREAEQLENGIALPAPPLNDIQGKGIAIFYSPNTYGYKGKKYTPFYFPSQHNMRDAFFAFCVVCEVLDIPKFDPVYPERYEYIEGRGDGTQWSLGYHSKVWRYQDGRPFTELREKDKDSITRLAFPRMQTLQVWDIHRTHPTFCYPGMKKEKFIRAVTSVGNIYADSIEDLLAYIQVDE